MNKGAVIGIILIVGLFTSCSQSNDKLLKKIDAVIALNEQDLLKKKAYTVIALDSLMAFQWDKVYFMSGNTGGVEAEYISEQIGFDWQGPAIEDNYYRLLFTKDKQVVSYVDVRKDQYPIYFYGCSKPAVREFTRKQAVFATFPQCDSYGKIYVFIPVSCLNAYKDKIANKCK